MSGGEGLAFVGEAAAGEASEGDAMKTIRKEPAGNVKPRSGGIRQADATQKARLPPEITNDAVARAILDAADAEVKQHGKISGRAFEAMLKRAMQAPPGQMSDAATAAINHVIENKALAQDAERDASIIKSANACRQRGGISRADMADMMKRAWDGEKGEVRDTSATALRYVGWRDADVMDAGARELMTGFITAWYEDQMETAAIREGRRQAAEQLAQDKRDFQAFLRRDKADHKRQTYTEFKHDLKEHRIEASEWQSLMLWLQTGHKEKPITS